MNNFTIKNISGIYSYFTLIYPNLCKRLQVTDPDSSKRVAASDRKWPQVTASDRKWPQVVASGRK